MVERLVHLREVRAYLAYGWYIVPIAGPPPSYLPIGYTVVTAPDWPKDGENR